MNTSKGMLGSLIAMAAMMQATTDIHEPIKTFERKASYPDYDKPRNMNSRGNAIPSGIGRNQRKRRKLARQNPHSKYAK